MKSDMRRKGIWLGPQDQAAIDVIRERYGCDTESMAVRLALRVLAASPMLTIAGSEATAVGYPPRPLHARRSARPQKPGELR